MEPSWSRLKLRPLVVFLVWLTPLAVGAADEGLWRVGRARVKITPPEPVVLLGYGDRTGPYTSVVADLFAKALVLEDAQGARAVLVTADLVGFQAAVVTQEVSRRLAERAGLERRQLLWNASHTHNGPLVSLQPLEAANAVAHAALSPEDAARTVAYTRWLRDQLVELVCQALAQLEPAHLAWGRGRVDFPMNRRLPQDGQVIMADNPAGPTDRAVPVLRVTSPDGRLLAVVFGCACHNTSLTGQHNFIAGDYAGFAQAALEAQYDGALALFLAGCGGDANPSPRGSLELARAHGESLSREVMRVLSGDLLRLQGALVTTWCEVDLPLQPLSREAVAAVTALPSAEAIMAQQMLRVLDRGETLPTSYRAPLAVWQLGDQLTLVGLPAEPVARYVPLLEQALGVEHLWVSGYNNDCFGYLPTVDVIRTGGHEAIGVTLWIWSEDLARQVGFFAPEVEDVILGGVTALAREARAR